jgi:DNA-binding NarL/FixJ family response regulator
MSCREEASLRQRLASLESVELIRVLIADDNRLTREGLRLLLERVQDMQVVGEARDGQDAVDMAERVQPDVVLMDMKMPRLNGLKATEQIHARAGRVRILFVANSWDASLVLHALEKGAQGFVAKPDIYQELIPAIREVSIGNSYFSRQLSQ